ncbi:putative DNA binding domain-containing protein [Orbaceae bacterium ac157xtp]
MIDIQTIEDIESLIESDEVEIKSALGKDGKGQLPKDFWSTYSAMANSKGGWVILGVEEICDQYKLVGIENVVKIKKELVTSLNNKEKVNFNLLTDNDIKEKQIANKTILIIRIPPASRNIKPIYINNNINNSYIRMNDSDIKCDEVKIQKMLIEKNPLGCDSKILKNYTFLDDINIESLQRYRNLLSARNPTHPFLKEELIDFFKKIGGWKKDRETGDEGPTLAGLLMFGNYNSIVEICPKYAVDYQERAEAKAENRWIDRIYYDGTWSGNVFDFYMLVYPKLISNLKIPFNIKDGIRQDDTSIHQALREAFVNALVHADYYTGRVSVLVVKRPDMFGFRNPGLMLIPKDDAITGGTSECRNPLMHQMFLNIGLGERAGSGIPKIYSGWESVNWKKPSLRERDDIEQTILELSTTSLIPQEILDALNEKFVNEEFASLDKFEQMIVATVAQEGWINHQRACELTSKHPRDVTLALPNLEKKGFIVSLGDRKNKIYKLPGEQLLMPDDIFSSPVISNKVITSPGVIALDSGHKDPNSGYKDSSSGHKDSNSGHKVDSLGRMVIKNLDKPFIYELESLDTTFLLKLKDVASAIISNKRINFETIEPILFELCKDHYISLSALSSLIGRHPDTLRKNYIKKMVQNERLKLAFPHIINDPKQGYTSVYKE